MFCAECRGLSLGAMRLLASHAAAEPMRQLMAMVMRICTFVGIEEPEYTLSGERTSS